jgi:hypothetical protein
MKDQYFGDSRDYFKYHLLEDLMGALPQLKQLTILWMLTEPDETGEGNVAFADNAELPRLTAFLRTHLDAGDRSVLHMRDYFAENGIEYTPWHDEKPYFVKQLRRSYFRSVPDHSLQDALVFLDPDIGLTTQERASEKHLTFHELAGVLDRMNQGSVAVVYQHFNRVMNFWERRAGEIREHVDHPVGYVADPDVGFYVIPTDPESVSKVDVVLHSVASSGRNRRSGACRT